MILVIFVAAVVLVIVSILVTNETSNDIVEDIGGVLTILNVAMALISFIAIIVLIISVSSGAVLDENIELFEKENARIEQSVAEMVTQYQTYEQGIIAECSPNDAMTVVMLYPDLKSDSLVKSQIDIYMHNRERLIELKQERINLSVVKWWLYFGG